MDPHLESDHEEYETGRRQTAEARTPSRSPAERGYEDATDATDPSLSLSLGYSM
jgi:hypothetical protein